MASKEDLVFGEIAVKSHFVTQEQLNECLEKQRNNTKWNSLGAILVEKNYLTPHQLQFILNIQKRNWELKAHQSRKVKQDNLFGRLVIRLGFATDRQVEESLGMQLIVNDGQPLRLGEIMVKKGFITEEQLNKVLKFQSLRQAICPGCGRKYNLVLFNDGATIPCYICDNKITAKPLQNFIHSTTPAEAGQV
ncbi:MAG: hypothetical protein QME51_01035 [Planctomycetota bacterium]|nr:hypothetical protein [Planctomycetota bacterium]MDI6786941.1 hypothetical protein [Planctomycetota bacterium]